MKYYIFHDKHLQINMLSLWQTPEWKRILQLSKQAKEVFYFGNPDSTFFLVEIRSLGAGFFGAFSLGVKNFQIASDFFECSAELGKLLQEKGVIFWQIEPIEDISVLKKFGRNEVYKKFLTPYTRIISLENDLEKILADMPQKGRYAIKNAEKKGVEIEIITDFSNEIIDKWMSLLKETTDRDDFSHNSREYYEYFLRELGEKVVIVAAKWQGAYIAMTISVFSEDMAIYYYGASTSDKEARRLASTYLTLWKSMEYAKQKGKKVYDLFGVADPNNQNDLLLGVSQFKQKLGGELQKLPDKKLFAISWKYKIYSILVNMRGIIKKYTH